MATFADLQNDLSTPARIQQRGFRLVQELCQFVSTEDSETEIQELVLRALEHRTAFGASGVVIDGLAREVGLFPYLDPQTLSLSDLLAYECHRPAGLGDEIVLHHPQAVVYRTLLQGESVVLSAPTSFGKSLVIDALLASGNYNNVVIVVPTLALIDETRRRLARRFRGSFKIITHHSQVPEQRNVFVLTQERVLERDRFRDIDLFVIDEFYKLDPANENDGRSLLLNQAFYQLHKLTHQFYMLGPHIESISAGFQSRVSCRFLHETYSTVVSEVHELTREDNEQVTLINLCRRLDEPTIIYTRSPTRAAEVAGWLVEAGLGLTSRELTEAADWCDTHYHSEWHFGVALRKGIGVHHGRIPRSLAQYVVRQFNDEKIPFLICTSTLIEGVNTQAKNIIIFDNKLDRRRLDLFTFNNIRGRSGRMMRHFVGRVYVFDRPPQGDLPEVDVPVFSQPNDTPTSLLIQIDDEDLTPESRERLRQYNEQTDVGYDTLRANVGVPLEPQLSLARYIARNARRLHPLMSWTRGPEYAELELICNLIWDHFGGVGLGSRSIRTSRQLAFYINLLQSQPLTREVITRMIGRNTAEAEEYITRAMDFLRLWAGFHFPRLLRAIDRIQRDVFARRNPPLIGGNYEFYAAQVEHFFFDPALVALDEYGIPLEVARKFTNRLQPNGSVDEVLDTIRGLNVSTLRLSQFERRLVQTAKDGL